MSSRISRRSPWPSPRPCRCTAACSTARRSPSRCSARASRGRSDRISRLEHEAANARRIHRRLRGYLHLVVPAPVTRLAAEEVPVREWIDDGTTPEAVAAPDDPAAGLVEFVLGGCAAGVMNSGLTAADVLVLGTDGWRCSTTHLLRGRW